MAVFTMLTIKQSVPKQARPDAKNKFRLYDGVPELMAPPMLMRIAALWAREGFLQCEPLLLW